MRYTAEQDDFLREVIPGRDWRDISELFERRFGVRLTKGQIGGKRSSLGVASNPRCGRKGCATPTSERYQIGDEKRHRGDVWVKVAKGGSTHKSRSLYKSGLWKKKQNLVWEEAHGTPLPDGWVVMFANRDRLDFDPANLVAVPLEVSQHVYGMKVPYHDADTLQACVTLARIRIALKERRRDD